MTGTLEIIKPGPLALIQDLGRPGFGAVGVGCSGAADRASFSLANRLVGNPPGVAAIEVMLGGLSFRSSVHIRVAITGAPAPTSVDGRPVGHGTPIDLAPGQVLTLGLAAVGLRAYVAVADGIDARPVLGSRAFDTMSGLGPDALAPGMVLRIGAAPTDAPTVDFAAVAPATEPTNGPVSLRVLRGPRDEWLADYQALARTTWLASSQSDRVGVRLEGTPLARAEAFVGRELASEGVVRGAIQVPSGGLPVLFLADHPVTGGYPVVGVIRDADVDALAQVRPGQEIRFQLDD